MTEKIQRHLAKDPILAPLLTTELTPVKTDNHVFEALIRAIVFQQLSGKAAKTIHTRFVDLLPNNQVTPEHILSCTFDDLRAVGLSRQKVGYVQNVAAYFQENMPNPSAINWQKMDDETIIKDFTSIKGVGEWTVQMLLIFTLNRPNILPTKDLAIQQAIQTLYGLGDLKGKKLMNAMEEVAAPWAPYRSYATRLLWKWRDTIVR